MIKPGSHEGNLFSLTIKTRDPEGVCGNLKQMSRIPGYYGPQRFGVLRPSSHLYGLAAALREAGRLVEEFSYRYPLESGGTLSYEVKAIEDVMRRRDPWVALEHVPGIALEALQAYLFNRALSEAISMGYLDRVRETVVRLKFCGDTATLPAVRLPSPELVAGGSTWAQLVKRVAEIEGVDLRLLKGLKASLRPLYFPFKLRTCAARDEEARVTVCLPSAAYVTILLWEATALDWSSLLGEREE